jgi:hypothetical protein
MPYIKEEQRKNLYALIDTLAEKIAKDAVDNDEQMCGRLNYTITKMIHAALEYEGVTENYASYNELIGMLECAKLELYRKKVAPYEDNKIKENGDV